MYDIFVHENYISSWLWSDIFLVLVVLNNMLYIDLYDILNQYINILLFLLITIIVLFNKIKNKIINCLKIISAVMNRY